MLPYPLILRGAEKEMGIISGRKKLQNEVHGRLTEMFDEMLNFAEVAVPNKYTYDKLRNRILTSANNAIRDLQDECEKYDISYEQRIDEVVRIGKEEE